MHTAEHILNGTMVRMFGCGRSFSAHIERKKSKCDYRLATPLSESQLRGVEDAVKLACFPTEEWGGLEGMNLDALTEFKRGSNGVVELKFTDRARLLERLLDAADHSGEDQVDRFLSAMERQEEGK